MDYCIVEGGIIENIIVCDNDETAELFHAVPSYPGARIGEEYDPPAPEPEVVTEDLLLEMAVDHEARLCMLEMGI